MVAEPTQTAADLAPWLNKVVEGDCLTVMADLPDGCVDLLLTDPPYATTVTNFSPDTPMIEKLEAHGWDDSYDWVSEASRLMRPSGAFYVWSNFRGLSDLYRAAERAGWRPFNLLAWLKTNPMPSLWYKNRYRNGIEVALYGAVSDHLCYVECGLSQDSLLPYWQVPIVQGHERSAHPTQKPLSITLEWIRHSCPPGGIVLDPFAGSGTTAVACIAEDRQFICIEREPEYVAIAEKRIAQARRAYQPALAL